MGNRRIFLLFSLVLFCLRPSAHAEPVESFQLSFFHPAQIHDQDTSIDGFRFNLLYGLNKNMRGVDLGIVNNVDGNLNAFQLGLVNVAETVDSLQLGLHNAAENLGGLQIGVVNLNHSGEPFVFLPLINFSF